MLLALQLVMMEFRMEMKQELIVVAQLVHLVEVALILPMILMILKVVGESGMTVALIVAEVLMTLHLLIVEIIV